MALFLVFHVVSVKTSRRGDGSRRRRRKLPSCRPITRTTSWSQWGNLSTVASKKDDTSRRQFTTMNHNKDDVYTDYFPVYKCSGVARYANDDGQYRCTLSMILLYQGQVVPLNGKTETDLVSFFGETYGKAGNACAEHVTFLQQAQPF